MTRLILPLSLTLSVLIPVAASAAVLAESKVSNGFYWQKTSTSSGSIRYICRSTNSGKFQKHQKCKDAGAVKPHLILLRERWALNIPRMDDVVLITSYNTRNLLIQANAYRGQ